MITLARSGERGALDVLLRRHYDRIHAVCRRIVGPSRDADDATQETMIKIVRSLHSYDGRAAFSTWAYRIATNTSLDELRRRGRRPMLHSAVDDHHPTPDPPDPRTGREAETLSDRLALDAALGDLPEDYRVAVVLRDVADLDYDEIAAALDIPVGTVKSRIARGRGRLAEALGNQPDHDRRPSTRP